MPLVELLKDEFHVWFNWSLSPSLAVNVRGMVLASSRLLVPGTETSASDYEKWIGNSVYVTINMNIMNNIMVTGCMKSWSSHEFNIFFFYFWASFLMSTVAWLTQWKRMRFLVHVSPHKKTGHNVYVDINSSRLRMDSYHVLPKWASIY